MYMMQQKALGVKDSGVKASCVTFCDLPQKLFHWVKMHKCRYPGAVSTYSKQE